MRERPILLNGDMVRAVLNGSKTQTRRIMKVQPDSAEFESRFIVDSTKRSEIGKWCWAEPGVFVNPRRSELFSCPFGQPGDRLWVRETWSDVNFEGASAVAYRADEGLRCLTDEDGEEDDPRLEKYSFANWYPDLISGTEGIWRPSIHMPRWASRITLEITGVRVERLQDLSDADAHAEGCPARLPHKPDDERQARTWFRGLWSEIYGEASWQANPWLWVIEFKRVEGDR